MRRWPILVFLLLMLPFQMVWAAAAPVCGHESEVAAQKHFGHHEHRHQGSEPTSASADDSGKENNNGSGAYHADCENCHLGTSVPLNTSAMTVALVPHGAVHGDPGDPYRSHVPSGPERPDRIELPAAARFGGGVEFRPLPS